MSNNNRTDSTLCVSKLPKFLQKANRDRARSMTDPMAAGTGTGSSASIASSSSSGPGRKGGSWLGGVMKKAAAASDTMDEPPVIIEPVPGCPMNPNPRPRTRSERPSLLTQLPFHNFAHRRSANPTPRWFTHAFSSSTDLSLPSLLSQSSQLSSAFSSSSFSTKTKGSAFLSAVARHLDRSVHYLLDSDARPDRCVDSIWSLGVRYPGYEPSGGVAGVSVATDECTYQYEVSAASTPTPTIDQKMGATKGKGGERERGDVRCWCSLGLDWVWTYHDTIKILYTFPQSVGIAGSRPSSYYFVGSQAVNMFYLDPHHARPAVPRRPPPPNHPPLTFESRPRQMTPSGNSSSRGHRLLPPLPLPPPKKKQFSTSSQSSSLPRASSDLDLDGALDALREHYVNAYSAAELRTFHCERVRKMPLSGLDPSVLLGFSCKDWED
ncbi:hypothetical protein PILCRDRAFT_11108 [Piloderma croceum F 1598]|uniref:Cysteine protease n=1 Tax=Piloderma croceum (strain F 1598) TaxID=765440 RepID=A0A0C3AXB8_PILCF|nr:hypothetical protein PILCRDRAFT_11108 [Piloderma croceum F 1598]